MRKQHTYYKNSLFYNYIHLELSISIIYIYILFHDKLILKTPIFVKYGYLVIYILGCIYIRAATQFIYMAEYIYNLLLHIYIVKHTIAIARA